MHRGELAQVMGPHLGVNFPLPESHVKAAGTHRLDVSGPLVNEYDIEPGIREVGGDTTSVRAGAENCDFLAHDISKMKGVAPRRRVVGEKD
jgi:hypothetical protein